MILGAIISSISLIFQVGQALHSKKKSALVREAKNIIDYLSYWKDLHSFLQHKKPMFDNLYLDISTLPNHIEWDLYANKYIQHQKECKKQIKRVLDSPHSKIEEGRLPKKLKKDYAIVLDRFAYHVAEALKDLKLVYSELQIDFSSIYTRNVKKEPEGISDEIKLLDGTVMSYAHFLVYINEKINPHLGALLSDCDDVIRESLPLSRSILDLM